MYKVSLGQYLRQNFMNRPFHNASLIFFGTVSRFINPLEATYPFFQIESNQQDRIPVE